MEIASQLVKLQNINAVHFHGFSARPSALLFEYCSINIDGEIITNVEELVGVFNENKYFVC